MVIDLLFFLYVQNFSKYKVNHVTRGFWPLISSKKWKQVEAFSCWTAVRQHGVGQHCSAWVPGPACPKVTMELDKMQIPGPDVPVDTCIFKRAPGQEAQE